MSSGRIEDKLEPISAGQAYWRAATTDGSEVFYTEDEDLYRFNVNIYEESMKDK